MFAYLRIFSLISLIAVVGMTLMGGLYLREHAITDIMTVAETSNISYARGYVNEVWKRYREIVVPLTATPDQLRTNPQVAQFAQDTVRYFQQMPVIRINIYSANG